MSNVTDVVAVLELCKDLGAEVGTLVKQGTISWTDLPKLAQLWTPAKAALAGVKNVPGEITGIDAEGVQTLLTELVAVVEAWMAAFEPKTPA